MSYSRFNNAWDQFFESIVLFSLWFWCPSLAIVRSRCAHLSIYQSSHLKQQITPRTITIFFRRHSSRRRPRFTITSNRRCTLEWCSVITVQGFLALSLSYLLSLFFFLLVRAHTHTRLFPLSHPWLMSLVYRAKTKRHCCNRVKLVFGSLFLSLSRSFLISPWWWLVFKGEKEKRFQGI